MDTLGIQWDTQHENWVLFFWIFCGPKLVSFICPDWTAVDSTSQTGDRFMVESSMGDTVELQLIQPTGWPLCGQSLQWDVAYAPWLRGKAFG